jgi:membrane-associated phospholipid phosphatase
MDPILAWGLDVVRGVQTAMNPALTAVMRGLSVAGAELCFLVILPLVYWCVDKRRGLRMGVLVFLSEGVNARLKLAFAQPRPYQLDPAVGLSQEPTYGLPSGHAQRSVVIAGKTAPLFKKPWGLVVAIAFPLLVGLSRVYLGVHFPTDVFAGWALGALFLALDFLFGDRIERLASKLRESLALAIVTAVALFLNLLTGTDAMISGAFFGFAGAAVYARKSAPFSVDGSLGKRALRFLVGIASVALIYVLPKLALAGIEAGGPPIWRFARYALVGAWVSLGAPWLFMRLGLASEEAHSASENEGSVISK